MTTYPHPQQTAFEQALKDFVDAAQFPCVGAKAALARDTLSVLACGPIDSAADDPRILQRLHEWSAEYAANRGMFRSLAVVFDGPLDLDEKAFEAALWERACALARRDAAAGEAYDPRVSADPADPHFSLSFGGEGYFVVGLHPHASRPARRFAQPVMVFNLHDQFVELRRDGRYEKLRETILARDEKLAGSVNPMIARHGDRSEAQQYSGRAVGADWVCPFHDPRDDSAS